MFEGTTKTEKTIWEDQGIVLRAHSRLEGIPAATTQTRCPCNSWVTAGRNVGGSSIVAMNGLAQNHMLYSCLKVLKARARGI